jgi:hypothetical protein
MNSRKPTTDKLTLNRLIPENLLTSVGLTVLLATGLFACSVGQNKLFSTENINRLTVLFIVGLTLTVLGVIPEHSCTFNAAVGKLTVRRKTFFSDKITAYSFLEIARVYIKEDSDTDGSTYQLILLLKPGNHLPLTDVSSSQRETLKTANLVCQYLGVSPLSSL